MSRREYFKLCMAQDAAWLKSCAASPSASMKARHIALVLLALRKKA